MPAHTKVEHDRKFGIGKVAAVIKCRLPHRRNIEIKKMRIAVFHCTRDSRCRIILSVTTDKEARALLDRRKEIYIVGEFIAI